MPTTTIDTTAAQATRISEALGKELNLKNGGGAPRSATNAEYRAWLIDLTKRMVFGNERRSAEAAIPSPDPLDIT